MLRTTNPRLSRHSWPIIGSVAVFALASAACDRVIEEAPPAAESTQALRETDRETARETQADTEREADRPSLLSRLIDREPRRIEVPAGTTLEIELLDTLSSHTSQPGDPFTARVTTEVRVGDDVAVPAGATVHGTVAEAQPARKIGGRARLSLDFQELRTDEGVIPIAAALSRVGKSQAGKDAAIIGGSTVGGAILGEAIDDGDGDIIGAIVGGLAGTAAAAKTKGKPVSLDSGTTLAIELQQGVTVEAAS